MADIGPGDFVECVRVTKPNSAFAMGAIYVVEAVIKPTSCDLCASPCHGLHLVGMHRHPHGWCINCFKPVYRPKSDLIETLKQPAPEMVD